MFTLAKLAYIVCDEDEKSYYNDKGTPEIVVKSCCMDLLRYLKKETDTNNIDAFDDDEYLSGSKYYIL